MVTKYYLIIDLWLSLMTDNKVTDAGNFFDFDVLKHPVFFFWIKRTAEIFLIKCCCAFREEGQRLIAYEWTKRYQNHNNWVSYAQWGQSPFEVAFEIQKNIWFHKISFNVEFISNLKCSNWLRILKFLLNFGCLFTFFQSDHQIVYIFLNKMINPLHRLRPNT